MPKFRFALLFVGLVSVCFGCAEHKSGPALPAIAKTDPFSTDLEGWSCESYLQALQLTPHDKTLKAILEIRPHAFQEPAEDQDLVALSAFQLLEKRTEAPIWRNRIHSQVAQSLKAMMQAAKDEGLELVVLSAHRSLSHQNLLWKRAIVKHRYSLQNAAFSTAPPCFSEHASGMAVDFVARSKPALREFSTTPEYAWLKSNGQKWGWKQSFSAASGAVSHKNQPGIQIEPWHFRHNLMGLDGE
ncbi:MAG: M15 family metallopeptidase [Myxococcota bacterium]